MTEQSYEETVLVKDGRTTRRFKLYHDEYGQVLEWDMVGGRTLVERGESVNLRDMYDSLIAYLLNSGWRKLGALEQLGDASNG